MWNIKLNRTYSSWVGWKNLGLTMAKWCCKVISEAKWGFSFFLEFLGFLREIPRKARIKLSHFLRLTVMPSGEWCLNLGKLLQIYFSDVIALWNRLWVLILPKKQWKCCKKGIKKELGYFISIFGTKIRPKNGLS